MKRTNKNLYKKGKIDTDFSDYSQQDSDTSSSNSISDYSYDNDKDNSNENEIEYEAEKRYKQLAEKHRLKQLKKKNRNASKKKKSPKEKYETIKKIIQRVKSNHTSIVESNIEQDETKSKSSNSFLDISIIKDKAQSNQNDEKKEGEELKEPDKNEISKPLKIERLTKEEIKEIKKEEKQKNNAISEEMQKYFMKKPKFDATTNISLQKQIEIQNEKNKNISYSFSKRHIVRVKDLPALARKYKTYKKPSQAEILSRIVLTGEVIEEKKEFKHYENIYDFIDNYEYPIYISFSFEEFWEIYSLLTHSSSIFIGSLNLKDCKWIVQDKDLSIVDHNSRFLRLSSLLFLLLSKLKTGMDNISLFAFLKLNRFHKDPKIKEGENYEKFLIEIKKSRSKYVSDQINHAVKIFYNNAKNHFVENIRKNNVINIPFAIGNEISEIEQFPELLQCYSAVDSRSHRTLSKYVEYVSQNTIKKKRDKKLYAPKINSSGVKNELTVNFFGLIISLSTTTNGSVHDSKLFANNLHCDYLQNQFVLADLGYESKENTNVICPIKNWKKIKNEELKKKAHKYNKIHSKNRYVVENTFGRCTQLFQIFNIPQRTGRDINAKLYEFAFFIVNYNIIRHPIKTIKNNPNNLLLNENFIGNVEMYKNMIKEIKNDNDKDKDYDQIKEKLIELNNDYIDLEEVQNADKTGIDLNIENIKEYEELVTNLQIPFSQQNFAIDTDENNEIIEIIDERKNEIDLTLMRNKYPIYNVDDTTPLSIMGRYSISSNVMARLCNDLHLDSDCIDTSLTFILQYLDETELSDVFIMEANSLEYLNRNNYQSFIERINVNNKKIFVFPKFIPLEKQGHWSVYVFYPMENNYDNYSNNLLGSGVIIEMNSITTCHGDYKEDTQLIKKFWNEICVKEGMELINVEQYRLIKLPVPSQTGSINCGVFVCYFVYCYLASNPQTMSDLEKIPFDYDEAVNMRYFLSVKFDEIIQQELNKKEITIDLI